MSVIEIEPRTHEMPEARAPHEAPPLTSKTGEDDGAEAPPLVSKTELLFGGSVKALPFIGAHLACVLVFFVPFAWKWVGLAVALYYLRMFGITAGFHRYFAHRSYKTSRVFQFLMALLGTFSIQKGVLWWAAHHRAHHRYSDTELDIHSPTRHGILWAHVGWILSPIYEETDYARIPDFGRYPELRWLNRWYMVPSVAYFVLLFLVWGMPGLCWGGFVSTALLWHGTFTINSLSHVFGTTRYKTTDTSKNNLVLALITMGEGWHNNHHYYQASANQGFFWWEIDASYYLLCALEKLGIVWDVKRPPQAVVEGNRAAAA